MSDNILITPIDDLVSIVKSNRNSTITTLKFKLKVPMEILERWLVVLEEYGVIKVEYKGFEGFVNYVEKTKQSKGKFDIYNLRNEFIESSKQKKISFGQMQKLWPKFISEYEAEIKKEFVEKAKSLGYDDFKIKKAWVKFRGDLDNL